MRKIMIISLMIILALTGCNNTAVTNDVVESSSTVMETSDGLLTAEDLFTDRDLENDYDIDEATTITLNDNQNLSIDQGGVYILSGQVEETTVTVETDEKVQLVLDGLEITNEDQVIINILSADKVFITSVNDNHLEVTGAFTDYDSVIYSKSDLVLNGTGTLEIVSAYGNGISSNDDLKVTSGTLVIDSKLDGLEAHDSIRVYAGEITIVTGKDALHSENSDDDSLGYIYIYGGNLNITADDDAIRATSLLQIDGGSITIEKCTEGIEATYVQINGGLIDIYSLDDGINAANKSSMEVAIEVTAGDIHIEMASGDTDGFDSNGNLYISGGTINVEAASAFDADGNVEYTGGEITVNGEEITEITMQHPGMPNKNGH